MKKVLVWLGKAIAAGICALIVCNTVCLFYYNVPVRYENKKGFTDYVWQPNMTTLRGNEGLAMTQTDANGLVNTYPKKKDRVDVLLMGSSHLEGFNVNADQNTAYLLNELWDSNDQDTYAYNIAVSGHSLDRCLRNLGAAVSEFQPTQCVVIETSAPVSEDSIRQVYEDRLPVLGTNTGGLVNQLQKLQYLRLGYLQMENFLKNTHSAGDKASTGESDEVPQIQSAFTEEELFYWKAVLQKAQATVANAGCDLILMRNTALQLDKEGQLIPNAESRDERLLKQACLDLGISYVDLYEPFAAEYQKTHCLPHGFINSRVGVGHLNSTGHRVIADTLYSKIAEEART